MSKVVDFKSVNDTQLSKDTKRIRKSLFKAAANGMSEQQDGIRGFALVTWDDRGEPTVAVNAGWRSPVSLRMLPSYVEHQLLRYVAMEDKDKYGVFDIK